MSHAARCTLLIIAILKMCGSSAVADSRGDARAVNTDTFAVVDGVLELDLNSAAPQRAGFTVMGKASVVADLSPGNVAFRVHSVDDQVRLGIGGDLVMRCPPFGLTGGAGVTESYETLRFMHDATGESGHEFSILDQAAPVFHLTGMRTELRRDYQALIMEGDVRSADELAERLGLEATAGAPIGRASITMRMVLMETVVTVVAGEADGTSGPDVIVGDLPATEQFGRVGPLGAGTVGLSVGTTSCNKGDTPFNWFALPNTDHPMIPMNMYRLKTVEGAQRFEQIGQSWMKHGFFALQMDACELGCVANPGGGTRLGVGCSDPYDVWLNASQCGLGPRSALNPYTGEIPSGSDIGSGGGCSRNYPSRNHRDHAHDGISHRLQVLDTDLLQSLNVGAAYFVEGQYITPHEFEAANGNQLNNVSYRRVSVNNPDNDGVFTFTNLEPTVREQPAINAWAGATLKMVEPEPLVDGLAIVGYSVTPLGSGRWRYEYAVYNMNLDRSIRLFRVPVPSGVNVMNIAFHAPLNHAAEPGADAYSNEAWDVSTTTGAVEWSTATITEDPLANAIRFGTLYSFRFDADSPARDADATLGFFKTGDAQAVAIQGPMFGASDCNQNGVSDVCDFACSNVGCDVPGCGGSLDCNNNNIPDECDIEAGGDSDCNEDGVPDGCAGCTVDCECDNGVACTVGVCVSGGCVQESTCDSGLVCDFETGACRACIDVEECDDADLCTTDNCTLGACIHTVEPCFVGLVCDPRDGECKECVSDGDCSGGRVCDTKAGHCVDCLVDSHCDDGVFCNGSEECVGQKCRTGDDPCPGRYCRPSDDLCVDCLIPLDCDNSDPCDGIESCAASGVCEPGSPEVDCNNNGIEDDCDIDAGIGRDCQPNGVPDVCDIAAGTSMDKDGNGVPDECVSCLSNSDCVDLLICTFDLCVDSNCSRQDSLYGDVAGPAGSCGPDGIVDLRDILAVLDAFQGEFTPPCTLPNLDLACGPGTACCEADGIVDLLDILAVLNAFQGSDECCTPGR